MALAIIRLLEPCTPTDKSRRALVEEVVVVVFEKRRAGQMAMRVREREQEGGKLEIASEIERPDLPLFLSPPHPHSFL